MGSVKPEHPTNMGKKKATGGIKDVAPSTNEDRIAQMKKNNASLKQDVAFSSTSREEDMF